MIAGPTASPISSARWRAGDLGQVLLVKQRELQRAADQQLLDLRRFQRRDPAHPVSRGEQIDVGLGDHSAITHHDHPLQAKPRLQLGDLRAQRLIIMDLSGEHLDRDRAPGLVTQQSVNDLRRPAFAVTGVPQSRQRA